MSEPTEPGWYWWRHPDPPRRWQVIEVIEDDAAPGKLWGLATGVPDSEGFAVDVGEWGPRIPEPTEDGGLRLLADTLIHSNGHRLVERLERPAITRRKITTD